MWLDEDCFCCILKIVEQEFRKEQLAALENRTVDWSFAKNALRLLTINDGLDRVWLLFHEPENTSSPKYCASCTHAVEVFWNIVELLMKSFEIFKLRETILAVDLMRHAFYFAWINEMNFELTLEDLNFVFPEKYDGLWCLCEREWCENGMLTEAQFRQLLKTPYNTPYPVIEEEREQIHKHVVWCAIREGHEPLVSGFLKYGVMFLPTPNYMPDRVRYREALNQLLRLQENYQPPEEFRWLDVNCNFESKQKRRAYTVLRVVELLALDMIKRVRRPEPDEPTEWKSPLPARYAEDISACKSVYFRCLRRAFETIPEPFVSSNEVRKILRHAYSKIWDENLEHCVNDIISDLEKFHPEVSGPVTPRSLQHLSRCQVRENLRQSGNLPHGIKELGLTTLQMYLALEE